MKKKKANGNVTLSALSLRINGDNVRAQKIYPIVGSRKTMDELKTVALCLTNTEALHLSTQLLVAAQSWPSVYITGWRRERKDKTHDVTVTTTQRADLLP